MTGRVSASSPLTRARSLPASCYVDDAFARRESERVLLPSWQLAGHEAQLPERGSFLASEHLGRPIALTRDGEGTLHAFENVCRHRAGPVVVERGCAEYLTCRYHGWVYGLDGRLLEARDFGAAEGFRRERVRLRPLALHAWRGLIFAHRDADGADLAAVLTAVGQRLGPGESFEGYRFARRVAYELACNWKVYVDNYLEGYHLPMVHPDLSEQLCYGDYRTEAGAGFTLQASPLDRAITRGGTPGGEARYVHLYPNTMLNCLPGRLQTNVVLPLGPERCRVVFEYFYDETVGAADRDADQAASHQTQLEDGAICEAVQRNLAAGTYVSGRLSPRWEEGLWAFQSWLRARIGDA